MSTPFKATLTWHQNCLSQSVVEASPMTSPSAQKILNEITRSLPRIADYTEIIYSSLSPEEAELICRSLDGHAGAERKCARFNYNSRTGILRLKIMPIDLHDVHQRWINRSIVEWGVNGTINDAEADLLWSEVGTTFKNFAGGYQGSIKQPDHFLRVDSDPEPRIVVESGWGKTFPHLRSDKNVWLEGHVSVILVILLKWSALSNNRIKGTAEIWRRDGAGNLVSSAMSLFPAPVPLPQDEWIRFTKAKLFGPALSDGTSNAILGLDIARLRNFAAEVIQTMGMQPA